LKTLRTKRGAFAALLLAGVAVPAIGQDTPESLLPPGFNDPAPTTPAPQPTRAPSSAPATPRPVPTVAPVPLDDLALGNSIEAEATPVAVDLTKYELPAFAKHSLARVGAVASGNEAFPADAMGTADGRFLQALLARLDAPVASRWGSIALRRALLSPLDTPANINGADFAAGRAWVLLRMGESVAARAVIADVDADNFTIPLYQVAMQSALANADPGALCGIAGDGSRFVHQRGWALAQAICAGLAGKPKEAGQLLDQARQGTSRSDIDNLLAEKVLGTGAQGSRAVTLEWNGVVQLNAWRWGLATATGETVPDELYASAGPQVRYWQALSPRIAPSVRAASAELAATSGVFSNAGLVDLYGEIEQDADAGSAQVAVARDLRTAYTDSDVSNRIKAIRTLWDGAETPRTRYARLILTARAASWIPARAEVEAPERLIASMLSAGYDRAAMEWRSVVPAGSEGWALLTLADPAMGRVGYGDFETFSAAAGSRKAQLMLAALAGLGKLSAEESERGARAFDVRVGGVNSWTQAIDGAGERGEPGTVALLAAVGMQSRGWASVSPEALFHICAAMRAAGLGSYARMIAVEAITRA
jgi:hypothetical protein